MASSSATRLASLAASVEASSSPEMAAPAPAWAGIDARTPKACRNGLRALAFSARRAAAAGRVLVIA